MAVAGHSLGEYSALVAAGALDFADALRLVRRRGRAHAGGGAGGRGGHGRHHRHGRRGGRRRWPPRWPPARARSAPWPTCNGPVQTVIAGHKGAIDRAVALAKERGARKATLLAVSAPFHSPLMRPAREGMTGRCARRTFRDPAVPVVTNVDAAPVTTGDGGARRPGAADRQPGALGGVGAAHGAVGRAWTPSWRWGRATVLTGLDRRIALETVSASLSRPGAAPQAPGEARGEGGGLMFRLDGKTALVTGASQGIGEGIARLLARQGARVVLAARSEEKLEALAARDRAARRLAHAARPRRLAAGDLRRAAQEPPGGASAGIDILVNNAGITADNLLARMSLEDWERVLRTNLTGAFALTKEVVRGMMKRRWGRIINVSSVVGLMGNAGPGELCRGQGRADRL